MLECSTEVKTENCGVNQTLGVKPEITPPHNFKRSCAMGKPVNQTIGNQVMGHNTLKTIS